MRITLLLTGLLAILSLAASAQAQTQGQTWISDNGNGSYTNPLFYEEFSDPDVIRVGDTYYLAGTTMHAMPGLTVLKSKDLVNWQFASYCFDRLDLGPEFRLENNREMYGQGIWAPAIRHHDGTFFIFSNINGHGTQVFRSRSADGPWQHSTLKTTLYDLSVLFEGDKVYAVCGVDEISLVELNRDITDVVPGTRRVIIPRGSGMGEGLHVYKIENKYFIVSAHPGAHTPMVVARSDKLDGPWQVETMVRGEALGVPSGNELRGQGGTADKQTFDIRPATGPDAALGLTIHQGGMVSTPSGQWWSVIMQDHRSVGRLSNLVPITWQDGWPLVGLPGNLRRAPKTWIKPDTGHTQAPISPFKRSDSFSSRTLQPIWQWNHLPDDSMWSLSQRAGWLRLRSLHAPDFWRARNTLTQRAIGPASTATIAMDASGMKPGDVAGLGLLNLPYAWIGVARQPDGALVVRAFNQNGGKMVDAPARGERFWLRAECDFDADRASFSFSMDGRTFAPIGEPVTLVYQLKTFQGVRYSLFHFNTQSDGSANGAATGHADFDGFTLSEPRAREGRAVPIGQTIRLTNLADNSVLIVRDRWLYSVGADDPAASSASSAFLVVDRGQGRIALQSVAGGRFLSVGGIGGALVAASSAQADQADQAATFQWIDLERGQIALLSLSTNRYVSGGRSAGSSPLAASSEGPRPDRRDGSCFTWKIASDRNAR